MQQVFVDADAVGRDYVTITGDDARHLIRVVRIRVGERLRVSAFGGESYLCEVAEVGEDFLQADIVSADKSTELPAKITLFQALPKGDRMETIVEKAVELGVSEIVPVATRYCVVRLDEKKAKQKVARWQAIAESAAKQSKRSSVPLVRPVATFEQAKTEFFRCDARLFPYENARGMSETAEALAELQPNQKIGLMIGPEGGFSPEEVEAVSGEVSVLSLGRRILRTDTAAIAALSMIMLELERKSDGSVSG